MTHGPSTKSDNFITILQYWENCLRNDYSYSCVTFVLVTFRGGGDGGAGGALHPLKFGLGVHAPP